MENKNKKRYSMKAQLRGRLEKFRPRIIYLPKSDKLLVNIFLNGYSFTQIASVAGVSPAAVSRRLVKIVRRLSQTNYMMALRNYECMDEIEMKILRRYYIKGQSMNMISMNMKCSRYYVSKVIRKFENKMQKENL